jgi:hypothetical protein
MFVRIVGKNLTMNHYIKDTEKTNTIGGKNKNNYLSGKKYKRNNKNCSQLTVFM